MTKRRKKSSRWLIGGVVAIFIIAGLLLASEQGDFLTMVTSGAGFTVVSITENRTISNDADLAAANFIVDTRLDGANNCIVGYITPEEFAAGGAAVPTEYPLELTTEAVNEYAEYPIRNQNIQIVKYALSDYILAWQACPSGTVYECGDFLWKRCIIKERVGLKGKFDMVHTLFDVKVKAKSHGEEASGIISTASTLGSQVQTAVDLILPSGEWVGQARWTGNLQTGFNPPATDNFATVLEDGESTWTVLKVEDWQSYANQLIITNSGLSGCDSLHGPWEAQITNLNAKADWLLALPSTTILSDAASQEEVTKADASKAYRVNLKAHHLQFVYPAVVWYVKATWVGAYIPVGKPKIISTGDVEVWSGESATLEVVVQNQAPVEASFDATIQQPCTCIQDGVARETIGAWATQTITIRLNTGAANVDEEGNCQVKVYATTKPSNQDTAYFSYESHKARECPEVGKYKGDVQTDCISICGEDGFWHEVKCCAAGEDLKYEPPTEYDGWRCVDEDDNGDDDDCYRDCVEASGCEFGFMGTLCRLGCQVKCWFIANLIWFVAGTVLLVAVVIWKVFKKASPHMRVAKMAYRGVKGK